MENKTDVIEQINLEEKYLESNNKENKIVNKKENIKENKM